jgi:hypothetical protein
MQATINTPSEYIATLPPERQGVITQLHNTIMKNLPKGFQETMAYGMITYAVPHSLYPKGYHCNPKQALPFISIASQKNFIALYHMGIYANPSLLNWFVSEYPKHAKTKLDMGKSCIRFKKVEDIPYTLIAELIQKVSVKDWITTYENAFIKQ